MAVSVFGLGFAGVANAANVTSFNPPSMIAALQNAGYKAVLSKTDDGDPVIDTGVQGNSIRIVLSNCADHKDCDTTEFLGVWNCASAIPMCQKIADEMNNEESPVKLLPLEQGKKTVTYMYLFYDEVGISEKLFVRNLEQFGFYNTKFNEAVAKAK
ncbi:hypothetical protein [Phenylobacterium aquaticum]|uniref:hypothetical protein n=1 Tax=Phenylobacterium aquaticum TaxID=1763816 RepID=UPI001F5CAD08|nr:hypothetical protein [Phenylobacterium aquaticum]MCI3134053.1 hypothetical protein [Phenylobacterium aquaticum]